MMATQIGQKSEITLVDILPLVLKHADLAEVMPRIRLISKFCPNIVDEACLRFNLKFGSADDCNGGTKYFQLVLAKNKDIEVLTINIRDKEYMHHCALYPGPPAPSPEDVAFQNAAYALPLQRSFAASPTQWPNLKELELYILKTAASSFGEFTPSHFPNLERLTLSCYSLPEDFQLELPTLSNLRVSGCPLASRVLTGILCNRSLRYLTTLYLDDALCDDWSAFQGVKLQSLKRLIINMQEYSNDLLDNLRRGVGKALQNLEALRIHCCDVPLPLFHPNLPEPQEFKPIHHLFVNNSDFRYLQYLDLDFMWGCQSPVDFIKIARACPYLETLSLGNWFHEPQQDICDSEETSMKKYSDSVRYYHFTFKYLIEKTLGNRCCPIFKR